MAITRKKKTKIILGNMVSNRISSFVAERSRIRDASESRFLDKVAEEGLTYEDQIKYRKAQIAEEKKAGVSDKAYIKELNTAVRGLSKLNRAQKFRDEYIASFEALKTQRRSFQQHLSFLENSLSDSTDLDLQNDITDLISKSKQQKFTVENTLAQNKATFAINDKSLELIDNAIRDISSRRAQALASDDKSAVLKWDSTLRSLRSNKQTVQVENDYNDFEINSLSEPTTATSMLNFYRDGLSRSGGDNIPLTIKGKRYGSLKEFWQGNLNNYVQNKFFSLYQIEQNEKINNAALKLTPVLEQELRDVNEEINDLANLGELKPFSDRMDQLRTSVNFNAVQKVGQKVMDDYQSGKLGSTTISNFNIARSKLSELNQRYDVDVSSFLTNITEDFASKQAAVVKAIEKRIVTKGETFEEAEKKVGALDIPKEEIVTKSTRELVEGVTGDGEKIDTERFKVGGAGEPIDQAPKVELPKKPEPVEPAKPAVPEPATVDFEQIDIQQGDTLSQLATKFGTTVQGLQDINKQIKDPNLIIAGEKLNIPKQQ